MNADALSVRTVPQSVMSTSLIVNRRNARRKRRNDTIEQVRQLKNWRDGSWTLLFHHYLPHFIVLLLGDPHLLECTLQEKSVAIKSITTSTYNDR